MSVATVTSVDGVVVEVDAESAAAELQAAGLGDGLKDCAWCTYGKPAVAGAALGLVGASVMGQEPTRGVLYGVLGGLLFGWYRGRG